MRWNRECLWLYVDRLCNQNKGTHIDQRAVFFLPVCLKGYLLNLKEHEFNYTVYLLDIDFYPYMVTLACE